MSDTFTETTSEGFFTRMKNAIGGVIVGIIMILVAFPLIFWNEGRAVKTARSLEEGLGLVQTVNADKVDPAMEAKLVHMTAQATTAETLRDSEFGVAVPSAIRLYRQVEMYQWKEKSSKETKKKVGGGTETTTTYTYYKDWSDSAISSSSFKDREGHDNPPSMPYGSQSWQAGDVRIGAFKLSASLVGMIGGGETLPMSQPRGMFQIHEGMYYKGINPMDPKVGDVRVRFKVIRPCVVSLVAKQVGDSFAPFQTSQEGYDIEMLSMGTVTAQEMFADAMTQNTIITWVVRFGGFLLLFLGFMAVFKPLQVFADIIPFVGSIMGSGLAIFSFALAAPLTLVTIALGWIAYRPVWGVLLLVAAGAILYGVKSAFGGKKAAAATPPPMPGATPPPIPA